VLEECEGLSGHVLFDVFWLGGKFGEEFAGGSAGVYALAGEGDVDVEGEEFGAEVGEEFLAGGVEVSAGGGEEDELFPEPGGQHGDDVLEIVALALDGEDDRDGFMAERRLQPRIDANKRQSENTPFAFISVHSRLKILCNRADLHFISASVD